jgi:mono/diheme cytochrome c family protein
LSACLEDLPAREQGQWPLTRAEIAARASKLATAATGVMAGPGEAAYRKTCIACHGADGRGNGGKTAADFALPTGVLKKQDAVLLASITHGATGPIGVMPPHKALLSAADIAAVLAYVRQTFGPAITPDVAPTGDAGTP